MIIWTENPYRIDTNVCIWLLKTKFKNVLKIICYTLNIAIGKSALHFDDYVCLECVWIPVYLFFFAISCSMNCMCVFYISSQKPEIHLMQISSESAINLQ